MLKDWSANQTLTYQLVRFIGHSQASRTINALLQNVIMHVSRMLSLQTRDIELLDDFAALAHILERVINEVPKNRKLVLFLDGIDELIDAKEAIAKTWIPARIPANVKIVFSLTADSKAREDLKTFANIVDIALMDVLTTDEVLHKWLRTANRTLNKAQWKHVKKQLGRESHAPLYLKLIFDQIVTWRSFESELPRLGGDADACLRRVFEELDERHGTQLTKHCLLYVELTRHGIRDIELEDVLSLDDVVRFYSVQRSSCGKCAW